MILTPADLSVAISDALADMPDLYRDILAQKFGLIKASKNDIRTLYSLRRRKRLGEPTADAYDDVLVEALAAMREAMRQRGLTALHHLPIADEQGKTIEGRLQRKNPNLARPRPRKKVTAVESLRD